MESKPMRVLVTISGQDQPGITAKMTEILTRYPVEIVDIGQAVIHQVLSLSLLFELSGGEEQAEIVLKDLLFGASQFRCKLDYQLLGALMPFQQTPTLNHYAITLLAEPVTPQALHKVASTLARWRVNIDLIKRLSDLQFHCVEMIVSTPDLIDSIELKKELLEIANEQKVDIALQAEGLYRRTKRLIVLDMDSTLIQGEVIDELARAKGTYEPVSKITHEAMMGKIQFDESLRRRCETLKGLSVKEMEKVYRSIQLTPGAKDLIYIVKKLGYKVAVISGGFSFVADRLKRELNLDYSFANELEIQNGVLTGRVHPPVVNARRKSELLDEIAKLEKVDLDQVIAVGDGANDIPMLEKAGLGIAFNAKPLVREKADLALSQKNLRSILYLLGLSAREIAEIV